MAFPPSRTGTSHAECGTLAGRTETHALPVAKQGQRARSNAGVQISSLTQGMCEQLLQQEMAAYNLTLTQQGTPSLDVLVVIMKEALPTLRLLQRFLAAGLTGQILEVLLKAAGQQLDHATS